MLRTLAFSLLFVFPPVIPAQGRVPPLPATPFDTVEFADGEHHWYDITDEERVITPDSGQGRYPTTAVREIAENTLLYQKTNGGWPKNYDMRAILSSAQRTALEGGAGELNTTIDNGATHSQIEYLAHAAAKFDDERYRAAALRGIDFLLGAQYPNGGWPQFYPQTKGYRKYITFNDGAMVGVMELFRRILRNEDHYLFVDDEHREKLRAAYEKGIECILRTQIVQGGVPTAWCQQHDQVDLRPRSARSFEPAAVTAQESAGIVRFLMKLHDPSPGVIASVQGAVRWFVRSRLSGIRVEEIAAPPARYEYHATATDRVVVEDAGAPPLWARFYELGTNRPLFSNRDGKPVYTLAEVERERRTGYAWYTTDPARVLKAYSKWRTAHGVKADALAE
jgi:PelA/Pel-15E family pectate lyase